MYDPSVDLVNELNGPPDMTRVFTRDELLDATVAGQPWFEPDDSHSYSNGNYFVLGAVLEAATGTSAADLLAQYVTEPLGLTDTLLFDDTLPETPVVNAYTDLDLDGLADPTGTTPLPGAITSAWTAGGVISTGPDLAVFLDALFNGEILTTSQLDELTDVSAGGENYALGIYRSGTLWGHDGGIKGYLSAMFHDESGDFTVVVLTNAFGPGAPQADAAAKRLATLIRNLDS